MKPGRPAVPTALARVFVPAIQAEPTPEPQIAPINGYLSFKLTPNIAGSVIPSNAEIPEALHNDFCFGSLDKKNTARTAAP